MLRSFARITCSKGRSLRFSKQPGNQTRLSGMRARRSARLSARLPIMSARFSSAHKVDEERRPWAVRSIKLRGVRRFSYLSSAMHFVAFGPRCTDGKDSIDIEDIKTFMKSMSVPPLDRLVAAWSQMGGGTPPLDELLALYD